MAQTDSSTKIRRFFFFELLEMSIRLEMPENMSEGQPLTNSNITSQMDFLSNLLILSFWTSWADRNSVYAFSQGQRHGQEFEHESDPDPDLYFTDSVIQFLRE